MALTMLTLDVGNPVDAARTREVDLQLDSGVIYSVIPALILKKLGIEPVGEVSFTLASGDRLVRRKGVALFKYAGRVGGADVLFGEKGDGALLGATTLASLGLVLDPLQRELREIPMTWGGFRPELG
ncbi:MAG: aspartyl protease [Acidobacteriota bacterium]